MTKQLFKNYQEAGIAIPFFALTVVALLMLVGLAVDIGLLNRSSAYMTLAGELSALTHGWLKKEKALLRLSGRL